MCDVVGQRIDHEWKCEEDEHLPRAPKQYKSHECCCHERNGHRCRRFCAARPKVDEPPGGEFRELFWVLPDPRFGELSFVAHVSELALGHEEGTLLCIDCRSSECGSLTLASWVVALPQLVSEVGSQWNKGVHHCVVANGPG